MPCPLHTSIPSKVSLLCKQDKLKDSQIQMWAKGLKIVIQINATARVILFLHLAKQPHLMILSLFPLKDRKIEPNSCLIDPSLLSSARE